MSKTKSLVAKFLSIMLMPSCCFAQNTSNLYVNKNFSKNIQRFGNAKKNNNFKHKSKETKALRSRSNLHKKDINSSLKGGNSTGISPNALKNSSKPLKYKNSKRSVEFVKSKSDSIERRKSKIATKDLGKIKTGADRNKFLETFLKMAGKTGNLIKNNPLKTTMILFALMYGGVKFGDMIGSDAKVFNELEAFVKNYMADLAIAFALEEDERYNEMNEEFKDDRILDFLFEVCTFLSYQLGANYSTARTGIRRILDMFLVRGATTRQRKSVQRLISNGKGSCWEAAFTFDFCLRMCEGAEENKKIKSHHIVISHLSPSIYHTFNLFEYNDNWYFCDPLAGVMGRITDTGALNHEYLKKYIWKIKGTGLKVGDFFDNYETNQTLNLYVLEQINQSSKIKPLGMMQMAPFMTPDKNDKVSFMIQNEEEKYVKNPGVEFNGWSSVLFG